jgi:hypothetical protein
LFGAPRHARKPKTDAHLKTAPKPENKNYDHFRPISEQACALPQIITIKTPSACREDRIEPEDLMKSC